MDNELIKELYDVIKTSGWLDRATEYFRKHPEFFQDCINSDGKIANITMSVSYQPESFSAVKDTKPCVFMSMGNINTTEHDFNIYDTGTTESRTWKKNKLVMEERSNV